MLEDFKLKHLQLDLVFNRSCVFYVFDRGRVFKVRQKALLRYNGPEIHVNIANVNVSRVGLLLVKDPEPGFFLLEISHVEVV